MEYISDFGDDGDHLSTFKTRVGASIPIKSKLGVEMNWEKLLEVRKLKDLLKVPRIKAYQIFWNINARSIMYDFRRAATNPYQINGGKSLWTYGLSTGVTGMHLLPKFHVLFYTGNLSFSESAGSIARLSPGFNAAVGVAKIKNPFTYYYGGIFMSYENGQFLPIPFLGIESRLGEKFWFNITLPLQIRFGMKMRDKSKLEVLASMGGNGSGFVFSNNNYKSFFRYSHMKTGMMWNKPLNKRTRLYLEGGITLLRSARLDDVQDLGAGQNPKLGFAPYVAGTVYHSFGKSFFGQNIGDILGF